MPSKSLLIIKSCTEKQLPEILDIFNDAILNSTALYDYKIRTLAMMSIWYNDKLNNDLPIIGAFDENDVLLGFATYGPFRVRPAYKYTVEHSVYVRKDKRGFGVGKVLLKSIIEKAVAQDYHVLVGVIDDSNIVSKKMHEEFGFALSGIMHQVGFKFGRWLDAAFYELILCTPNFPEDDV